MKPSRLWSLRIGGRACLRPPNCLQLQRVTKPTLNEFIPMPRGWRHCGFVPVPHCTLKGFRNDKGFYARASRAENECLSRPGARHKPYGFAYSELKI
jgi:hypothetical protein